MEIIKYPPHVIWKKDLISEEPLHNFSKRHIKRLNASLPKLEEYNISYELSEVNDDFIQWFEVFYTKYISSKNNPKVGDIRSTVNKYKGTHQCFGLKITENGNVVGGALYINKNNRVTTAFKALYNNWNNANLSISPSLYAEYVLYTHAINYKYNSVSHGQDRNPYGINSDIGLCAFKLSLGYKPSVSKNFQPETIEVGKINQTSLILDLPAPDSFEIKTATLFLEEKDSDRSEMLLKYPETLTVTVKTIK